MGVFMIKVLTGSQMKNIDQKAIAELGIPGIILMENAGRAVCDKIINVIKENNFFTNEVLIICGKGNNGGDGFVIARHLIEKNIPVSVISLYSKENLSGDALINYNILKHFTDIIYFDEIGLDALRQYISEAAIVVDAILGTGLNSEVKGDLKDIINSINEFAHNYVVAVDIPSGVDSATGQVLGCAVQADCTVTFFAPKVGTVLYPGADHTGELIIEKISIPEYLITGKKFNINLLTSGSVITLLPQRHTNTHKGSYGSVFSIAGSLNYPGAAYLCTTAALKAGAGYSTLCSVDSVINAVSAMTPEIIYERMAKTEDGSICADSLNKALDKSSKHNVFLIGPGLTTNQSTGEFIKGFINKLVDRGACAIIDADGLNILSCNNDTFLPLNSVITPHPMELARLLKISVQEVLADRIKSAINAALRFNTIVVLKGAKTIISQPNGTVFINPFANSALATAGTGDILAGIIAGFAAQGLSPLDATIGGVYIHGLAGTIAASEVGEHSVTAVAVLDYVSAAIMKVLTPCKVKNDFN